MSSGTPAHAEQPYGTVDVAVRGGMLRVGRWGTDGPAVLALHGVTANHLCWAPTARRLARFRVLAPDLRGRGRSADLPGPYGMAVHAADAIAVLDALGVARAIVVGHSMGGFAALSLAHLHPDRVAGLVLVDGGPPLALPATDDPDAALESVIGPAAQRLSATFRSREAAVVPWRDHPAMAEWNDDVRRYVEYDLTGTAPRLRSSCSLAAVRGDTVDLATGTTLRDALTLLTEAARPVPLLRAPAGLLGEPGGLYDPDTVATWQQHFPALRVTTVDDTNHYTILLGPTGADAVAATIRQVAGGQVTTNRQGVRE